MKKNQFLRPLIVSVLWLCLGAGCRKDPPEPAEPVCKEGCCYNYKNSEVHFVAHLNGVSLVALSPEYMAFKEPVLDTKWTEESYFSKYVLSAFVCELDAPIVESFKAKRMSEPDYQTQSYKIWGNLYYDPSIIPFNPTTRAYAVKIDRIEKAQ